MNYLYKLGIIGCGNMGNAIINQIITSSFLNPSQIIVSDAHQEKLNSLKAKNVNITQDNSFVVSNSEYIILAVKPQSFENLLIEIHNSVNCKALISIMAGITKNRILAQLPNYSGVVVRAMPNTPAMLGYGMTIVDDTSCTEPSMKIFVNDLFNNLGKVAKMDESMINNGMAISGSGPAYFYLFIDYLIKSAMNQNIDEQTARLLAVQTAYGSIKMIEEFNNIPITQLIDNVCSKGGTTIEAVKVFKDNLLDEIIDNAINKCVSRAKQMESEL